MDGYKKIPLAVRAHRQGGKVENHHKDMSIIPCLAQFDKGVLVNVRNQNPA